MLARLRSARRFASPSRARVLLLFRLRAGSWLWCCRKSDDRGFGIRSRRTPSAACGRRTRNVLSGLVGDEGVEIAIGEHLTRAFLAVADDDVAERAGGDVTVERLDRAAELTRGLGGRAQPIRRWR